MNFPNYLQNEQVSLPSVKQTALKSGFGGQMNLLLKRNRKTSKRLWRTNENMVSQ